MWHWCNVQSKNSIGQQSLVLIFLWFPITNITLTHKLLEIHGWVISTAAVEALVVMPRSHQTRSQYVLQNVAERGQTVCERNERCDNCLESFYELNGRFMRWTGSNGKDIPERRDCSKSWGDHPVPKLDGVATCLKLDGRSTNGIAVLRTY